MLYQAVLPMLRFDGAMVENPAIVIDRRIGKRGKRAITELLVQWTNSFPKDMTWESLHDLQQQFPSFNP